MDRRYILFTAFIFATSLTVYGQATIDQKVQQLKDAWYQKAQELFKLGTNIIENNKLLEDLQNDSQKFWQKIASKYDQQGINNLIETYKTVMGKFCHNLSAELREKNNINGLLLKELFENKGDYLTDQKAVSSLFFDKAKFHILHITLCISLLKKLVADYEECLQKMAEIENELVSLGQPRLYE